MSEFIPEKLFVEYKDGVQKDKPKEGRKYTLTHSDITADLFLTVGKNYDYEKTNEIRDEVIAEWIKKDGKDILNVNLQISIDSLFLKTRIRDKIFRQELPLALEAIVYGDKDFLNSNKNLYQSKIIVNFNSQIPDFEAVEEWGTISDYTLNREKQTSNNDNILYGKNLRSEALVSTLLTLLSTYIRTEINLNFGLEAVYCNKEIDIIDTKKNMSYDYNTDEFEVVVGVKVGKPIPLKNNFQITLIIKDNGVKVKESKKI